MTDDRLRLLVELPPSRLYPCQTLFNRFSPNRSRLPREYIPVAHTRKNPLLVNTCLLRDIGKLLSRCDAHLVTDHLSPNVQSTPEDPGKPERVVHLVRKVGSTCSDYLCTRLLRLPRPNLRNRIGTRENDRAIRHCRAQFLRNHARPRRGHCDQNIRPLHSLPKAARAALRVCFQSNLPFRMVFFLQLRALAIEDSFPVHHDDVSRRNSCFHDQTRDRDVRSPRPKHADRRVSDPLTDNL